jgi:glycerol uptake operon antiterminator
MTNILPAVRSLKDFEKLAHSPYKALVLLDIHIGHLESQMKTIHAHGFKVFIHLDLIRGLAVSTEALEFIHQKFKPYGIITTRGKMISKAKSLGLKTILRVFLIDSSSVEKSIELIRQTGPDYIEVLPGTVPKMIHFFSHVQNVDVIAGGLIETPQEVDHAIQAGAKFVTTSKTDLWFK